MGAYVDDPISHEKMLDEVKRDPLVIGRWYLATGLRTRWPGEEGATMGGVSLRVSVESRFMTQLLAKSLPALVALSLWIISFSAPFAKGENLKALNARIYDLNQEGKLQEALPLAEMAVEIAKQNYGSQSFVRRSPSITWPPSTAIWASTRQPNHCFKNQSRCSESWVRVPG
jgi:hypothetical protein